MPPQPKYTTGQHLWIHRGSTHERIAPEGHIIKMGRKYMTVRAGKQDIEFVIATGQQKSPVYGTGTSVLTDEEYEVKLRRSTAYATIRKAGFDVDWNLQNSMPTETLERVAAVLTDA